MLHTIAAATQCGPSKGLTLLAEPASFARREPRGSGNSAGPQPRPRARENASETHVVQSLQGSSLEERISYLQDLLGRTNENVVQEFQDKLDLLWIYHDSALEGTVYTAEEIQTAIKSDPDAEEDSTLVPLYDEIRQNHATIRKVRELAAKKRGDITIDIIKDLYTTLIPEEAEGKGGPKYRKDMPIHRLYFHEIAAPDKIGYQLRNLVQWMNAPETKRSTHTVRLAAKAHTRLLQAYPFPKQSGKVARLLMNLILLRQGYPPVLVHATERQRYYDALKSSEDVVAKLITEALGATIESTIQHFEVMLGMRHPTASP